MAGSVRRRVAHWFRQVANWLYPDIRVTVRATGAQQAVAAIERTRIAIEKLASHPTCEYPSGNPCELFIGHRGPHKTPYADIYRPTHVSGAGKALFDYLVGEVGLTVERDWFAGQIRRTEAEAAEWWLEYGAIGIESFIEPVSQPGSHPWREGKNAGLKLAAASIRAERPNGEDVPDNGSQA